MTELYDEEDWLLTIPAGTHVLNFKQINGVGTGGFVWNAARTLVNYLSSPAFSPDYFTGKRVVELGAGIGASGLVCALNDAKVVMTDVGDDLLELMRENMQTNLSETQQANVVVREYFWGADTAALNPPFDVVLGSDLVYYKDSHDDLIRALDQLSTEQTLILFSYQHRKDWDDTFFVKLAEKFGFEKVNISKIETRSDISLYRIWKKPPGAAAISSSASTSSQPRSFLSSLSLKHAALALAAATACVATAALWRKGRLG